MGATNPQGMVYHLTVTVVHRSESGETTQEVIDLFTDQARVLAFLRQLSDFMEAGQLAGFLVEAKPSEHQA